MQPEPINFKMARITPKWAFKQNARRWLVIAFFVIPFLAGAAAGYIQSIWSLLFAPFAIVPILCFIWLVGATGARADSPDEYLDEREIAMRNEVYLQAFRIIGAIISLGFIVFTVFPNTPMNAKTFLSFLFPIMIFLPTCVLAWTQPDPLEEA